PPSGKSEPVRRWWRSSLPALDRLLADAILRVAPRLVAQREAHAGEQQTVLVLKTRDQGCRRRKIARVEAERLHDAPASRFLLVRDLLCRIPSGSNFDRGVGLGARERFGDRGVDLACRCRRICTFRFSAEPR